MSERGTAELGTAAAIVAGSQVDPATTAADIRLAWLHLRLGMVGEARAELEDLERRGSLDTEDRVALAEVRWRTGDLESGAVAARAHLDAGGENPVAVVIAAEGAAANGEIVAFRGLVERVRRLDAVALDAIFAGMPRRGSWPVLTVTPSPEAPATPAMASAPGETRGSTRSVPGPAEVIAARPELWSGEAGRTSVPLAGGPGGRTEAVQPAETAASAAAVASAAEAARPWGHLDPETELERARDDLAEAPDRGLLRLALVLRLDPTLAPDVLDALRLRPEPGAAIIRGDAERLIGRHLEAEAAFADAADAIERDALGPSRAARPRPPDHEETP